MSGDSKTAKYAKGSILGDITCSRHKPLDIEWLREKVAEGYTIESGYSLTDGRSCITLVKVED